MRAKLVQELGEALEDSIERAFAAATSRTAELEKRLDALEERRLNYCGIWKEGVEHRRGDLVTHSGALWHCWKATSARPGTSDDWQLMQKNHRGPGG